MSINITDPVFHDEKRAREFLEAQRWPEGPVCPDCDETKNVARLAGKAGDKGQVLCRPCRKKFTVTSGTVMHRSKVPLTKWLMTFRLMAASKKGISAKQIERMLGVTYKTAWFLCHRVREAMGMPKESGPIGGKGKVVESDETFVGGKKKNAKNGKPTPKKYAVVALIERGGELRAKHVPNVTANTIRGVMAENVSNDSDLSTDESLVYEHVGKQFAQHHTVNHSQSEYVKGQGSTNTAEAFFSLLKRRVYGTHHAISEAHLDRYVTEAAFVWNYRIANGFDDEARANAIIKATGGKRLTYRRISSAANA